MVLKPKQLRQRVDDFSEALVAPLGLNVRAPAFVGLSSEASHLEAVVESGCAAIATTGPLLLRSGVLTGSGVSEYFITPDSFITNRGR